MNEIFQKHYDLLSKNAKKKWCRNLEIIVERNRGIYFKDIANKFGLCVQRCRLIYYRNYKILLRDFGWVDGVKLPDVLSYIEFLKKYEIKKN